MAKNQMIQKYRKQIQETMNQYKQLEDQNYELRQKYAVLEKDREKEIHKLDVQIEDQNRSINQMRCEVNEIDFQNQQINQKNLLQNETMEQLKQKKQKTIHMLQEKTKEIQNIEKQQKIDLEKNEKILEFENDYLKKLIAI